MSVGEDFGVTGYVYRVGGTYYQIITDTEGQWTFYLEMTRPEPGAASVSDDEWEQLIANNTWFDAGKADPTKTSQQTVDEIASFMASNAILNTNAAQHQDYMQEIANAMSGKFDNAAGELDPLQFHQALMATTYGRSTVQAQRDFDTSNPAEQAALVVQQAEKLASLWRTYTGTLLDVPATYEELQSEAPALFQQALGVASGKFSEQRAVLDWIQPEALKIEQSPWQRMLDTEDRAQRQESIDVDTQRGTARDLAESYGLNLSNETLLKYGQKLVDNELSLDELEQQLDKQAIATLYPFKPVGMTWVDYADPWRQAKSDLMEVGLPDHTDEDVQNALKVDMSLSDFKQSLRDKPEWLGTDNARSALMSAFGAIGRGTGFA